METITTRGFTDPVRIEAEARAIELATKRTDQVLSEYAARPDTFGGRYVCADSFKELMPGFAQSRESRSALNGAVHNAAAVLSSEQFRRLVEAGPAPDRDTVVFVTGIPGAGKSSTVASAVLGVAAVVFEGQLSRPEPAMQKIEQALEKGFNVEIVAVHVAPEVALERTNYRYLDPNNGRGASLSVMADIQGNLPAGLRRINERFVDRVGLEVLDNNPRQRTAYEGWKQINFLEKEGNRDEIYARLSAALDTGYREGRYSAGFYTQAAGRQPHSLEAGTRPQDGGSRESHGDRPGVSQVHSERHSLKDDLTAVQKERIHVHAMNQLDANAATLARDARYGQHTGGELAKAVYFRGFHEKASEFKGIAPDFAKYDATAADQQAFHREFRAESGS
ncbi:zeta toxin family protein [Herbaspirillum sp. GW103]|uniref:zeta toxin family protein n=1 Tax=Herbaspirillum sp. GW103 TaxID=1175306 RepID=UPI0012F6F8B4|nr:zeta toxin family protein [Herbaspirillum sp. GW103]